jgi:hypothetical protein
MNSSEKSAFRDALSEMMKDSSFREKMDKTMNEGMWWEMKGRMTKDDSFKKCMSQMMSGGMCQQMMQYMMKGDHSGTVKTDESSRDADTSREEKA